MGVQQLVIRVISMRRSAPDSDTEPVEHSLEGIESLRAGGKEVEPYARKPRNRVFGDRDARDLVQPAEKFATQL